MSVQRLREALAAAQREVDEDIEVAPEWDEAYARDDEGPEDAAHLHEVLWTDERDALGGELAHHVYELPVAAEQNFAHGGAAGAKPRPP